MGEEHSAVPRPRRDRPSRSPQTNMEWIVRVERSAVSYAAEQPNTAGYGWDARESLEFRQDGIIYG